MLLEVKDISVHYEKAEVLKRVSLEASEGMTVTIVGANGAGKTTILRAISGMKQLTSGEIWFDGSRIDGIAAPDIVKLGIRHVPEGRRVFPDMTTRDNIAIGAYLRRDTKEVQRDIERGYKSFPVLKARGRQKARSLSGGEQQMLVIQRALMGKPKLLLLDEPTLGLAPLLCQRVAGIIKDISEKGMSIILVEQNARLALKIAHRGYVLETGRVVLAGDGEELLHSDYVRKVYLGG